MWKGIKKRGSDGLNPVFGMLKSSFSVVKIFHTAARFWHGRKGSAPAEPARTGQEAQAEERDGKAARLPRRRERNKKRRQKIGRKRESAPAEAARTEQKAEAGGRQGAAGYYRERVG